VDCVVCLGTDKAVYPVNAMGMTKAIMEKVAQSAARRLDDDETRVCSVRYGNVMYSRGSVIPLFIQQIKDGQPLTITDPEMTRFLLPLRDSVELVNFAFEHARQGDVFIKKACACTIGNLAKALIELFQSDVELKCIGVRHGEKKHETLASLNEMLRAEDMGDFLRLSMDERDLNYSGFFTEGDSIEPQFHDYDSETTKHLNLDEIKNLLVSLPEVREQLDSVGISTS
jgi:UDP-glucose 4-epimerase